ncbi:MAG: hypothetical protein RLZZ179_629 [Verrucomicrobiota bacterium]|jgi:hypothetical protein
MKLKLPDLNEDVFPVAPYLLAARIPFIWLSDGLVEIMKRCENFDVEVAFPHFPLGAEVGALSRDEGSEETVD